MCKFKCSKLE